MPKVSWLVKNFANELQDFADLNLLVLPGIRSTGFFIQAKVDSQRIWETGLRNGTLEYKVVWNALLDDAIEAGKKGKKNEVGECCFSLQRVHIPNRLKYPTVCHPTNCQGHLPSSSLSIHCLATNHCYAMSVLSISDGLSGHVVSCGVAWTRDIDCFALAYASVFLTM